jgi:hypothetical protein
MMLRNRKTSVFDKSGVSRAFIAATRILSASSTLGNSSGNFKVAAVEEEERIFLSSSFDA